MGAFLHPGYTALLMAYKTLGLARNRACGSHKIRIQDPVSSDGHRHATEHRTLHMSNLMPESTAGLLWLRRSWQSPIGL